MTLSAQKAPTRLPSCDYYYVAAIVAVDCLNADLGAGQWTNDACKCSGDTRWCGGIAMASMRITGYGRSKEARDYDAISRGSRLVHDGKLCSDGGACYSPATYHPPHPKLDTRYNAHLIPLACRWDSQRAEPSKVKR